MSCAKPGHLYQTYYCKECKAFHTVGSELYLKHKDHKINRYYCKICGHTHIASQKSPIFIPHLDSKGFEIEYYYTTCRIKVMRIKITKEE